MQGKQSDIEALVGRAVVIETNDAEDPWDGERGLVTEVSVMGHEVCVRPFASPDTIVFKPETDVAVVAPQRLYDYESDLAAKWRKDMGLGPSEEEDIIYSGKGVTIRQYIQRFSNGTEDEYFVVSMPLTRDRTVFRGTRDELLRLARALSAALD